MPSDHETPGPERKSRPAANRNPVTLTFAGQTVPVGGTVRAVTDDGLVFVCLNRQTLPDQVTLGFGSGETFQCAVGRDRTGTEFALRFTNASAFAGSAVKRCLEHLRQLDERQSPAQIGDRLEEVTFFGDEEMLALVETCIDRYEEFVQVCKERLIPS